MPGIPKSTPGYDRAWGTETIHRDKLKGQKGSPLSLDAYG